MILLGNVGNDPEIKTFEESGKKVANFSLATNESYTNEKGKKVTDTEWHNIVAWGPKAELAEKYIKKGHTLYLEGKSKTRSYEKEGHTFFVTEIFADHFTFGDNKGD